MAIAKLVQEDPTLKVSTDPDTGQTILAGMGELHLEIIVDRMQREFNVGANVGKPQVAYRETIRKTAEYDYTHKKQTGGSGQYARVKLRVEPLPPGGEFEFENEVTRRQHSQGIHPGHRKGRGRSAGARNSGGLSDVGREGDGVRRRLSRCRFVGNGVQDLRFDLHQGSGAQGQAGAARAGDAGGSGGAGRIHGSGERRPDFAARAPGRHRDSGSARTSSRRWCRCRRCSAMRPSCARARRAAARSPCISGSTKKCPKSVAEEITSKAQGKVAS